MFILEKYLATLYSTAVRKLFPRRHPIRKVSMLEKGSHDGKANISEDCQEKFV